MQFLRNILRAPTFHFLLVGALLFGLQQVWLTERQKTQVTPKEEILLSRNQILRIKRDIQAQTGAPASSEQLKAGIEDAIDEEVFYRQALAMGLDKTNPSVHRRLIDAAKFVSEDPKVDDAQLYRKALELGLDRRDEVVRRILVSAVRLIAQQVPTPEAPAQVSRSEMEEYFRSHKEAFRIPKRYSFQHIFFSRDRRRGQDARDAESFRRTLAAKGLGPEQAKEAGDPFLQGRRFSRVESQTLQKFFGATFTAGLASLQPNTWSLPIASSYGWHLVWVEEIQEDELPPLIAVANQVQNAIITERKQLRLQNTLKGLRARYEIRVEELESTSSSMIGEGARD